MGTLVCTVELNKAPGDGIKVVIDNADDGITQTIQMDGTSVTITVKKGGDTSTYTQTAESVAIECKTFSVTASETITMTSSKASTYESTGDAVTVKAVNDLTLSSSNGDISASAINVKATGRSEVSLAMTTNKLELAAGGATLSSSASTKVSGGMVSVKADGMLTAEAGGVATLKGAMTNVQGNLVNLG